ncbi:MAG: elongation factor G [Actinomycetota bacterium]
MDTYAANDIRNVLLVGHSGSGKTTLLEAMLLTSGAITRMGSVTDGTTVADHEPEEVAKGISVSLAMAPIEWRGTKINVLDAPGTADFVGELRNAIRAVDAVVVVVSAVDGVEVQTEAAWELAVEAGIPRAILVNKLDRERASFEATLEGLVQAFGKQVAPLELPIGTEHGFTGVADLLHEKAYTYVDGTVSEGPWPDDVAGRATPLHVKLAEAVAESDDALIERYLETGTLPEDVVARGVKEGFAAARIAPVLCGSASRGIGVDRILAFIAEEFPAPTDRPTVRVEAADGSSVERPTTDTAPLAALVFKTLSDPYVGHISMFRVFSGTVRPDGGLFNATKGLEERVGQLFSLRGKEHVPVTEVRAGDIGAAAKLIHTHTGDTLAAKGETIRIPTLPLPEPVLAYAIEPKAKGDEEKLSNALTRLREEDPTIRVERTDETHQTILSGMGEAHLDVTLARMQRKFGVDVTHEPARIAYRETLRKKATATGRHVKQSGGHGQYAVCTIEVQPLPRGSGFEFVDRIVGGAVPNQFIPSVEKGVAKALAGGVVSGNPMVDLRVTLTDGKFHPVDSSDMAFQIAGGLAMREAAEAAGVALLEPVVDLEVIVPESHTGDVIGDLNGKRAKIAGMEVVGAGKQRIRASAPAAEVARYAIDLRSMTGGRGTFSLAFSHYEEVPPQLADRLIAAARAAQEAAATAKR